VTTKTDAASTSKAFAEWLTTASEDDVVIYKRFMVFAFRAYQQRHGTVPRPTLSERNGVREWLPKRGLQGMRADFAKALRNGMIAPAKDRPFSIFLAELEKHAARKSASPLVSRGFVPVSTTGGVCPSDKRHFRGAAKEVYTYLKLLSKRHGGFVFASGKNIAAHTKKWRKGQKPYSPAQCERIIRTLRALKILGKREKRIIHGRAYSGMQMANHSFWAEMQGDICDFRYWNEVDLKARQLMGNWSRRQS
jgi:hypothetical protein